jgi:hypothetical protein
VRVKHVEAFKGGIRDHIIWKLCPDDGTNTGMPVVRTTGSDDGSGRRRLIFSDLIAYLETVKKLNLPDMDKLFMILCPEHATDLILDTASANYFSSREIFFDTATGKVRSVMGFKFFENNTAPVFNSSTVKKAKGAVMTTGDRRASLFFYAPNAVYHLDRIKALYSSETADTKSADPKSVFRTQTYGLVDRIVDYGFGAIISDNI